MFPDLNVFSDLNNTGLIVAIVLSVVSLVLSIIGIYQARRNLILSSITRNRIVWISEVRKLLMEFVELYQQGKNDQLRIQMYRIELYMRKGPDSYDDLSKAMKRCCDSEYCDENCQQLVTKAQVALASVWERMKREAGIREREDKKIGAKAEKKAKRGS